MAAFNRRQFARRITVGAAAFTVPGLFASELAATPRMTEGPFYPDKMPLDTDNDLIVINNAITPAVGEITHLSGRILSRSGQPVRNSIVEIWQVDAQASYLHTRGRNPQGFDTNFQGYGRFMTDSEGHYYFRTIKPVPYALGGVSRAPHIHFGVNKNGRRVYTTQLLIRGHELNAKDGVFREVRDPKQREAVLVDFKPLAGSTFGELTARFDIVMGLTPAELEDGRLGIGKPDSGPGPRPQGKS